MKETGKVFGVLQRVGRAFMLPIAVLPVAGLLLGIGRSLTNETMLRAYHLMKIMGPGTVLYGVIKVGSDCGSIIFGNLPLIFAMGVSIGMAKAEKAVAALSGALSFFVMHEAISSMLSLYGDTYTMHAGATDQILGITSLQLGVFGGILVGLGVGYLHNRFYKIKLPEGNWNNNQKEALKSLIYYLYDAWSDSDIKKYIESGDFSQARIEWEKIRDGEIFENIKPWKQDEINLFFGEN